MRPVRALVISILFFATSVAQDRMIVDSLHSPAIGATKRYGVLLPDHYDPATAYPILYLLHGHDGSHRDWTARTSVASFVREMPLIVVFPDADNSWYVNAYSDTALAYETYLLRDLRCAVESRYRVDTTRRSIAGLSMGGYGALLYGFKRPELFRFAGSLSGAFLFPRFIEDTVRQPIGQHLARSLRKAFGPDPNPHRAANDVFSLAASVDTALAPYVYLATGIHDGFKAFLPTHRMLVDSMRARGIRYEYHETRGGHSWTYWGREIRPLISRMREVLGF